MAAPARIPYGHIDSTRKVTYDYSQAERVGRNIGNNLGKRGIPANFTNRRHIPLKRLPANGMLFTYMRLESNAALADDPRRKDLIAQLLRATLFDSCNYDSVTDRFVICTSLNRPKMKYFYTSPIASLGVLGYGIRYNIEICCRLRRDIDLAYLKSGAHHNDNYEIDLQTITQRESKFDQHPDFDYLRILRCGRIANSCNQNGNNNDICITGHANIIDNQISGIYCMATQDSLISFNNLENRDNLTANLSAPGRSLRTALDQINTDIILVSRQQIIPGNPLTYINYYRYLLYLNSILLTLEADYVNINNENAEWGDTGYLGFSEVTLYALGHNSLTHTQFMNDISPVKTIGPPAVPYYTVNIHMANDRIYTCNPVDLQIIFNNFYQNLVLVDIIGLTTSQGRINGVHEMPPQPVIVPHHLHNLAEIRARNTGIFRHGLENFNLHVPVYSVFHNMFISSIEVEGVNNLQRRIDVTKIPGNANPDVAANLIEYTTFLTSSNILGNYLSKAIMFQVNHAWRNDRYGRLIYLRTGGFNHGGQQPSISTSVINNAHAQMNDNGIFTPPADIGADAVFIIPGFRQLLTNKHETARDSPLYKLRHFLNRLAPFLMFNYILTNNNITNIINYIDNIPGGRLTRIDDGVGLAGGYRKKTRKSRIIKKKTHRRKNRRM